MINKYLLPVFAVVCSIGTVIAPKECIDAAKDGLILCFNVIIPSLFPFIVCAKIIIKSGLAKRIGTIFEPVMRPVFNVPGCGAFAFILGILSGYPLGAKCAGDLYESKCISKAEAERLICFCNNSGPLFIIGAIGAGMLGSKELGILLYVSHILSAISIGLIFRFYKINEKTLTKRKAAGSEIKTGLFSSSVSEGVNLILYICGFIVFFSVFLKVLTYFIYIKSPFLKGLIYGFFEMSNGINNIASFDNASIKLILISAIAAWGGVSVIMQVSGVISDGLSKRVFIAAKFLQALLAAGYTVILMKLPMFATPVILQPKPIFSYLPFLLFMQIISLFIIIIFLLSIIRQLVKNVNKL